MLTETEDAVITRSVLATMPQQQGWAASGVGAYGDDEVLPASSPFLGKGEALQISSHLMHVNEPYPFQFMEWWFVAVKRSDGELYFYYVGE